MNEILFLCLKTAMDFERAGVIVGERHVTPPNLQPAYRYYASTSLRFHQRERVEETLLAGTNYFIIFKSTRRKGRRDYDASAMQGDSARGPQPTYSWKKTTGCLPYKECFEGCTTSVCDTLHRRGWCKARRATLAMAVPIKDAIPGDEETNLEHRCTIDIVLNDLIQSLPTVFTPPEWKQRFHHSARHEQHYYYYYCYFNNYFTLPTFKYFDSSPSDIPFVQDMSYVLLDMAFGRRIVGVRIHNDKSEKDGKIALLPKSLQIGRLALMCSTRKMSASCMLF
ncbi:hypothetical protein PR048_002520 [Dryococelus australis]|uniref:Uncharacterized protein n=1 Tax=Dryococelus australis TaxID=614101 RepID=A0ABQ9ILU6_9NEOP|nr:hypothetical protein PR048_002520 [Dryococelus australis]